jgi:hypothetical protein
MIRGNAMGAQLQKIHREFDATGGGRARATEPRAK